MKRFAYAAAAIVLTAVLVVLAMAVAQRDARIGDASAPQNELPYANQPAEPIAGRSDDDSAFQSWPPAPFVRGNDSPSAANFPIEEAPVMRPSNRTSLAQFTADETPNRNAMPNDLPNNIRNSSSGGRLAEPPPLSALSGTNPFSFLSPNPAQSDSSSRNPSPNPTNIPSTLPNTLPRVPIADSPRSQPSTVSPSFPTSTNNPSFHPGIEAANPALREPFPESFPMATQPIASPLNPSPPMGTASFGAPQLPNDIGMSPRTLPALESNPPQVPMATLGSPMPVAPSPKNDPVPKYDPSPKYDPAPNNLSSKSSAEAVGYASAAPGTRQLDGAQNPSLEIRKRAPSEVQVGIPAIFTVLVRNVGNATAFEVSVFDAVPKGAKLIRTSPQSQQIGSNLAWKLGEMPAGSEQTITIELEPISEGEIGSVASVSFAAQASVRTISTQPKLVVKQLLESVVLGGDSFKVLIDVSNTGTGTARNVRLEEDVPQNMRHASGAKVLELSVGDLAPGESQKFDIELTAVSAGKVSNILRAVGENAMANESSATIEVVSPKLQVGLEGPKLRYLERQATYTASITNSGTAVATEVYMTVFLPMGLQFNSTENEGVYIPEQHAVKWLLTELAAGKTAATKLTLLPVEEGDFVLRMQANSDSIRADSIEKPVRVEGQSELAFSIEDDNDPIETDGKTTYLVKIVNTGTRVDQEIQLAIELPDGASVEQVDAPVNHQTSARAIQFAPIPQMKSKDQQSIRIVVRHAREGTHVLRASLKSKLRPGAVIKEESTQVYRDQ